MIAGLLKPTAGHVTIAGHDLARAPEKAKGALGFIPDRPFLYEKLTAAEFASTAASTASRAPRSRPAPRSSCGCSSSSRGGTQVVESRTA
ncbi:MAG: hypothetical protein U0599_12615 [Vicinamibacteria bacterium]